MNEAPRQITLQEWDARLAKGMACGWTQPSYGGPLGRHLKDGDLRLSKLLYDDSRAALDLWNFLLTEEERLRQDRVAGKKILGTMKDLGTVPVMAYSLPDVTAFYPDGAWWTPCLMEFSSGVMNAADELGVDESFCPVRAMLGAFVLGSHFPTPDLLVCSVGATCDDFSAIAQRVEGLGHPILWWEIPHRRTPDAGETSVCLPGGFSCPRDQVLFVQAELERVKAGIEAMAGKPLTDAALRQGIAKANQIRRCLRELRDLVFTSELCPMPSLELLLAEMLALHYCSDREACLEVLSGLLQEVRRRVVQGAGYFGSAAVKVFWVNPVADLRVMNLLEQCGGRICGTDYLFCHALDEIPETIPPMEALARMALADPMVGSASDRAQRICEDISRFGSEAVVVSRIPGASHCALEGAVIAGMVGDRLGLPVIELEVSPVCDAFQPSLKMRLSALVETARGRRSP
jgi:hypothetical protein